MDSAFILNMDSHVTDSINEDLDFILMHYHVVLFHSMFALFTLYPSQVDRILMFEKIAVKVEHILLDHPAASSHIFGNVVIRYK